MSLTRWFADWSYFGHMSMARLTTLYGAALFAALFLITAVNQYAFHELKVGGPRFTEIVDGKDLIADILPPPLYIVEPILEARTLMASPGDAKAGKAKLEAMHASYRTQREKWRGSDIPAHIRGALVDQASGEADKFWNELNRNFLPALESGDLQVVFKSMAALQGHFDAHRKIILKIVADSEKHLTEVAQWANAERFWFQVALIALTVALFAGIFFLMWLLRAQFADRLQAISSRMDALAKGDHDSAIPFEECRNEIGQMARALGVLRDAGLEKQRIEQQAAERQQRNDQLQQENAAHSKQAVDTIGAALGELAQGDLTARVDKDLHADYRQLKDDFNTAAARLESAFAQVIDGAESITSGTSEISNAADDLSRRTEQQAATLEETAAAVVEITDNVARSADGAKRAQAVVSQSRQEAENGGEVVGKAIAAMSDIEKSSVEIGEIIGVIDEIAFQTNLLALNAGVEAARAGEAGRGFAVVASEVRALAQRSAKAAKEIKDLISASASQVDRGVDLVKATGVALEQIVKGVTEINESVGEIARNAQEQAVGLREVNTAVGQLDQVTQENAAMVEESTAATRTLSEKTTELTRLIGQFRTGHARPGGQFQVPADFRAGNTMPTAATIAAVSATARRGGNGHVAARDSWEEF